MRPRIPGRFKCLLSRETGVPFAQINFGGYRVYQAVAEVPALLPITARRRRGPPTSARSRARVVVVLLLDDFAFLDMKGIEDVKRFSV